MSDWQPWRDHLRAHLADALDHAILNDPDPVLRSWLAAGRERILRLAVDQIELAHLRQAVAEQGQEAPDAEETVVKLKKVNGKRHHRWS